MPSSKVEPFFDKVLSKKITSEFNAWKILLLVILGCSMIVGIAFIIIFSAGN